MTLAQVKEWYEDLKALERLNAMTEEGTAAKTNR
jgi:hypothetical protein